MASKKRKKKKDRTPLFDDLSHQTKQAIWAVLIGILGVFLIASLFSFAGNLGRITERALSSLFGAGSYLAPFACWFYAYVIMHPREDTERVSVSKMIGITLLFISALGALELWNEGSGGMLGLAIEWPLVQLVDRVVAGVLLVALLVISIFLTFNTHRLLPRLRKAEPLDDTELSEEELMALSEEGEEEGSEEEEGEHELEVDDEEAEAPKRKSVGERIGLSKAKSSEFMVSSFEGTYAAPPIRLLKKDRGKAKTGGDIKANSLTIKRTLRNFGIEVEMDEVEIGPTFTRFALKPAQGVKISRIVGLQQELQLALKANSIRIEAPIPGKSLVGIEVPNVERASVGLASLLASPEYTDSPKPLLIAIGKDITGKAHFGNVARMPHALIAGTTGSGKSVMIHNLVISLLFRNSPEQLRFIMVDPKRVELTLYNGIPHLLTPVITEAKKAMMALKWAVKEMERRYDILQTEKVQNITSYHENIYQPAKKAWVENGEDPEEKDNLPEPLPYLVIIMDELADLMHKYPKELEALIVRIAQMARAVGIHLVLATQRPSVNVITGTIKANIPTRLAMKVPTQIDSRTIIDGVGAEKLVGQGDMLYITAESGEPIRLQSAFVSEPELKKVIDYLKNLEDIQELDGLNLDADGKTDPDAFYASMVDDEGEEEDEIYTEAKEVVLSTGRASTSFLQRKLSIGYSRAAKLIDIMEEKGVVGPANGSKPREILIEQDDAGGYDDDEEDERDNY